MKPAIFLSVAVIFAAFIAGFGFLAVSNPPVAQKQIVKTIPNERFF